MDIASVAGLITGWGLLALAILVEAHFDPAALGAYINPSGILIILGGTSGATILSYTTKEIKNLGRVLKVAFTEKKQDAVAVVTMMVGFASKARREGLLGLEEDINNIEDPFLKKGLQLVVDGTDMEMIREILETDTAYMAARHKIGADMFTAAGGFAPTLGIIGAVAGLIHALATVNDPSKLTEAIAVAFSATFYGIGLANLLLLPVANKLAVRSKEDIFIRELQIVGILAISAGDNPRIVEDKMKAFMSPKDREILAAQDQKTE